MLVAAVNGSNLFIGQCVRDKAQHVITHFGKVACIGAAQNQIRGYAHFGEVFLYGFFNGLIRYGTKRRDFGSTLPAHQLGFQAITVGNCFHGRDHAFHRIVG